MEELKQKVQENIDAAEILIGAGLNRQAASLLWSAIRYAIFFHLKENDDSFSSTKEAIKKIIVKYRDNSLSNNIVFVETIGLLCEWDEFFCLSDLQIKDLQDISIGIIVKLMPTAQINSKRKHYILLETEIGRHLQDTEAAKATQYAAAERNEKWYKQFLRIGFIITIVGISALFYIIFNTGNGVFSFYCFDITKQIMSLTITLLGAGLTLWPLVKDYSGKAVNHRRFAEEYNSVWKQCKNWQTDYPDEKNILDAKSNVHSIRERVISINNLSPATQGKDYEKGIKNRTSGSYDYSTKNNKILRKWKIWKLWIGIEN
ncbi:hypothetical protein FACS1894174_05270 [Bacteroidia bacterium]|nr:hypothetical protein FACS1894203_2000 [Bacteroidia bacterium]GHU89708.1 hypothetical protein FACS1894155_07120 [Bacteroidia bacterium]GHV21619.1 hypothetical protein FACS1894174_05270 [Bacteroidia bacterium]